MPTAYCLLLTAYFVLVGDVEAALDELLLVEAVAVVFVDDAAVERWIVRSACAA